MNNTFNLKRFGLLFKKTILERPFQLLGVMALVLFITFLVYFIFISLSAIEPAQYFSFIIGLVVGGSFIATQVFGYFNSGALGASYLTLPASHFEKWLCGVVITGFIYFPLFLLFYHFIDSTMVPRYVANLDPTSRNYEYLLANAREMKFTEAPGWIVLVLSFNTCGAALLGALYFNKVAFIKTGVVFAVFVLFIVLINLFLAKAMLPNVETAFPYFFTEVKDEGSTTQITLPAKVLGNILTVFTYILPVCLLGLSYIRLKEKEF